MDISARFPDGAVWCRQLDIAQSAAAYPVDAANALSLEQALQAYAEVKALSLIHI